MFAGLLPVSDNDPDDRGYGIEGEELDKEAEYVMYIGKADGPGGKAVIEKDEDREYKAKIDNLSDTENTEQNNNTRHGDEHGGKVVRMDRKNDKVNPDHDGDKAGTALVIPIFLEVDEPSRRRRHKDQLFDIDTPAGEKAGDEHGNCVQTQYGKYCALQFFLRRVCA